MNAKQKTALGFRSFFAPRSTPALKVRTVAVSALSIPLFGNRLIEGQRPTGSDVFGAAPAIAGDLVIIGAPASACPEASGGATPDVGGTLDYQWDRPQPDLRK